MGIDVTTLAMAKAMGGGSGSSGLVDWNTMLNKPFGEETVTGPLNIEWDGDTSGRDTFEWDENEILYKVSEFTPSSNQVMSGIVTADFDGQIQSVPIGEGGLSLIESNQGEPGFMVMMGNSAAVMVLYEKWEMEGYDPVEPGTYFWSGPGGAYVMSLVNENAMVEQTVIKQIELKYIPGNVGGSAEIPYFDLVEMGLQSVTVGEVATLEVDTSEILAATNTAGEAKFRLAVDFGFGMAIPITVGGVLSELPDMGLTQLCAIVCVEAFVMVAVMISEGNIGVMTLNLG